MVTNNEFLTALFGHEAPFVHVTDFFEDPSNIPNDKHLIAWAGDYFSRYQMRQGTNQYFTISNFYPDETGRARRRKALFKQTPVIVLDDVKEKLSMDAVSRLPRPAWVLETSKGSEQWGYILDTPCTERHRVENLLDGLVANGLAPDGKDPGMKGVTRYVRLPEGYNSKASKLDNGLPFKCQLTLWEPFNRVTIEQLAAPFAVNLDAVRREARVDGAAAISDHPLVNIPNIIHIKEVRSDGRFDITCPWVASHTGADDSGSAVFTNADGSIGFKCHHGNCQHRTGRDLLQFIDTQSPGFSNQFKSWRVQREFADIVNQQPASTPVGTIDFFSTPPTATVSEPAQQPTPVEGVDAIQGLCDALRREHPSSAEARDLASRVLKVCDDLPKLEQNHWHTTISDIMGWGKGEFKDIIKDLRKQWYGEKSGTAEFYDNVVFVKELNQFYDFNASYFYTPEAFQNSYGHEDAEARKVALQDGRVQKVDKMDYAPKEPRIFTDKGTVYANLWSEDSQSQGTPGDVSRWLGHIDALGWGEYSKHIQQWMAFTLRHPEKKINHMMLFGSVEGTGKDFILYPLAKAMGDNHTTIDGDELLTDYRGYLLGTKHLNINETELGDRREATAISNKLRPIAAAPPETLRVNEKNVKAFKIRNIVNSTLTTNSTLPLRLSGVSRRFLALWSDVNPRDETGEMTAEWKAYWSDRWNWMHGEGQYSGYTPGWENVAYYLINHVDLSDFNPNEAPPMTQFLRDITEASKSPMTQTIEAFINRQHGVFKSDLVTATDMSDTLKAGGAFTSDMYSDGRYFTPVKVGQLMREMGVYAQATAYHLGDPTRLWILRNGDKYKQMNSKDLYHEYERQMKEARGAAQLQIVK